MDTYVSYDTPEGFRLCLLTHVWILMALRKKKKRKVLTSARLTLKKSPHKHVPKKKGLTSACLPLFTSPNAKVCVCVCVVCVLCVCVCVCVYIECRQARHARTHTRRDDVCVRACVCVCVCVCKCVSVCTCVYACMYLCFHECTRPY